MGSWPKVMTKDYKEKRNAPSDEDTHRIVAPRKQKRKRKRKYDQR